MVEVSTFFIVVNVITLIATSIAVFTTSKIYIKYSHQMHAWLALSFIILFFHGLIRTVVIFSPPQYQKLIWFIQNVFAILGVWGIILSALFSQFDRLPSRAHWITMLMGIIIGLLGNPDFVVLEQDSFGLNASYHVSIGILILISIIVFIGFVFRPLIIKIKKKPSLIRDNYIQILLISYILLVLWAGLSGLAQNPLIRTVRPLIFSFALLAWGFSLYINPISVSLTDSKLKSLIVSGHSGVPFIAADIQNRNEMDATLITGLINAMKISIESLFETPGKLNTISFQDSIVAFVPGKNALIIMFVDGSISSNLLLFARVYLNNFEKEFGNIIESNIGVVDTPIFEKEYEKIFDSVELIAQ